MVNVERTFTVTRPVEVVVDYLKDFGHAEQWDPGTVSCTRVDTGPIGVGSQWHNVSEFKGKETRLAYRLERLEDRRLTFVGDNKTATSTDDITLAPVDGGTEITYHAHIVFHGLAKVADPFLKSEFEMLGDATAKSMTEAIESLPATSGNA
ncbi:SRPBCC family protein [Umezawaea sp. Da 62-37]|uniref:SRPBCC family protein n=1 Tax=Umezawaea sp. Da 62-37 TaxID=3075927 RepID=UPI0028F7166E|nr:SRPBCC family protein [Umezawaea sp. Da 62-37]WNV88143.1 SRPBCC family protein [Umezawaea sp. Da 62-37]